MAPWRKTGREELRQERTSGGEVLETKGPPCVVFTPKEGAAFVRYLMLTAGPSASTQLVPGGPELSQRGAELQASQTEGAGPRTSQRGREEPRASQREGAEPRASQTERAELQASQREGVELQAPRAGL